MTAARAGESDRDEGLGRRARKARATRQTMFEAGLDAFENRPLGVVSVLDITEASDVAKGVFYLHFRSKDEYLISLWENVQGRFLVAVHQRLVGCRSQRARIEAALRHYHAMAVQAPRECRFWLRMSSYFGDELGQPDQLSRSRQDYLRQLAALVGGVPLDAVGTDAMRAATIVDGTSWGLISQSIQQGLAPLDEESFVRVVSAAIRAVGKA